MRRFVDLFAGCGGLSLGLAWSGAQGLFAIEKDRMAFETFRANFLDNPRGSVRRFAWPTWLAQTNWGIDDLLATHPDNLEALRAERIDIIAGGPPCQGFSFNGRRRADDPRNRLFEKYVEVVKLLRPTSVVLENVPGMAVAHGATRLTGRSKGDTTGSFLEQLMERLDAIGYDVAGQVVEASRWGVPQHRDRLIVVGLHRTRCGARKGDGIAHLVFDELYRQRPGHLAGLGLGEQVSVDEAIGDLATLDPDCRPRAMEVCPDSELPGFFQLSYDGRRARTPFQRLMRRDLDGAAMDSMRLARHRPEVKARFKQIISGCRQGVRMCDEDRASFGLKKHRIFPMSGTELAPTITTLPDDVLHYRDPRILTVRESARLQSFPDWFVFRGKYTTGGDRRTRECPRYTQVGNAVPPLLALAVGRALDSVLSRLTAGDARSTGNAPREAART